jgi:energy-coupling factor transporter ATP-binding protein EcfA2
LKEEIEIRVKLGKRIIPYWGLSDGQRHRVNVALLISINRLCRDRGINNFNFLLLDEVLDLSLADKGQEDVMRLMRWILQELQTIIVISHRNEISSNFDYLIEVQRGKDEISRIVSSIILPIEGPEEGRRQPHKQNAL